MAMANYGPIYGCQHLFSAQKRAKLGQVSAEVQSI